MVALAQLLDTHIRLRLRVMNSSLRPKRKPTRNPLAEKRRKKINLDILLQKVQKWCSSKQSIYSRSIKKGTSYVTFACTQSLLLHLLDFEKTHFYLIVLNLWIQKLLNISISLKWNACINNSKSSLHSFHSQSLINFYGQLPYLKANNHQTQSRTTEKIKSTKELQGLSSQTFWAVTQPIEQQIEVNVGTINGGVKNEEQITQRRQIRIQKNPYHAKIASFLNSDPMIPSKVARINFEIILRKKNKNYVCNTQIILSTQGEECLLRVILKDSFVQLIDLNSYKQFLQLRNSQNL